MIRWITQLHDLKFGALMTLYETDLVQAAHQDYPKLSAANGMIEVYQDYYTYLKDVFFPTKGARLVVWEEEDRYISALRLEPYADGVLLCALMTAEDYRKQGYAKRLVQTVLQSLPAGTKVYSHVKKDNQISVKLHLSCGFQIIPGPVTMLNGELLHNFLGFLLVV